MANRKRPFGYEMRQGAILNAGSAYIEWDESIVRQLVDTVKVLSADRIMVCLQGGIEIEQTIEEES